MTYDDLLRQVQGRRFEIKMFILLFLNGIPNAFMLTTFVLVMYLPKDYQCAFPDEVSELIRINSSALNATLNYFIPYDEDGKRSMCVRYNRSSEEISSFLMNATSGVYQQSSFEKASTISCDNDHYFDNPLGIHSVAIEFDWTCDKAWMKPFVPMLFIVGLAVASTAGFLSDRYGRRPIFNIFTLLIFLTMFAQSFCNSTWTYGGLMFISGLVFIVNFITGFVLGAECTVPERRNFLSISSFVSYACGYGVTTLIFYLFPYWRWYLRICSFLGLLFVSNHWLVPESPRWLMANGRIKEAKKVLKMIAKTNNKPDDVIEDALEKVEKVAESLVEGSGEKYSNGKLKSTSKTVMKDIVKSPAMIRTAVVVTYSWFAAALVFYGISLSVQALSGNLFVNNVLAGLMEILGYLLSYATISYLSRPKSHAGMMIASGGFCMAAAFFGQVNLGLATAFGLGGKLLNAGAFYMVYIHTAEVFPTLARNTGMSLGSFGGRIGSIISPYFSYMVDSSGLYTPYIIMSLIAMSSGVLTLFFIPETLNVELPDTVEDSVRLKTLFSSCCQKQKKKDDRYEDGCGVHMVLTKKPCDV